MMTSKYPGEFVDVEIFIAAFDEPREDCPLCGSKGTVWAVKQTLSDPIGQL